MMAWHGDELTVLRELLLFLRALSETLHVVLAFPVSSMNIFSGPRTNLALAVLVKHAADSSAEAPGHSIKERSLLVTELSVDLWSQRVSTFFKCTFFKSAFFQCALLVGAFFDSQTKGAFFHFLFLIELPVFEILPAHSSLVLFLFHLLNFISGASHILKCLKDWLGSTASLSLALLNDSQILLV